MSSLFQGLATADGKLVFTTDPAGTVAFRGLKVNSLGEILIASDTGQLRTFHSGRAFDPVTGALLVDPGAITPVKGMGGLTIDIQGGVILKDQVPDVIHQGTGLTDEGYITGSGGGPPVPTGAAFYAPLVSDLTEAVAGYTPIFTRESDGWYWEGTLYQVAGNDVPRFQSSSLLIEPESTNLCMNYNANPDAGLTNMTKTGGGAAALFSRISDPTGLASVGLSNICSSGFVFELDNTSGTELATVDVGGATTAATHTVSCFVRKVSGAGASILGYSGGSITVPIVSSGYERVFATGTPAAGEFVRITVPIGDRVRFILNQSERLPLPSSLIVTTGASSSRARDRLSYVTGGYPVAMDTEATWLGTVKWEHGMPIEELPGLPNAAKNPICGQNNLSNQADVLAWQNRFNKRCIHSLSSGDILGPTFFETTSNQSVYMACISSASLEERRSGFRKGAGTWSWTAVDSAYGSPRRRVIDFHIVPFPFVSTLVSDVVYYPEYKNQAWVEANYPLL